jgi:hypothetical protein
MKTNKIDCVTVNALENVRLVSKGQLSIISF